MMKFQCSVSDMSAASRRRRLPPTVTRWSAWTSTPTKVAAVNEGRSPIVEPGLDEPDRENVVDGRLRATTDTAEAVRDTTCRSSASARRAGKNGSLDLTYLERVAEQIGGALRDKDAYHVVVVRSTVLPGTTHEVVIPALERTSGKKYGEGFGVSVNPEFLREGTALKDFRKPPLTLVGHNHAADASGTIGLYHAVDAPLVTHEHPRRGDDQVHEQHLARAQGVLRQRNRQPVQAAGRRQPRGDGHLLPRSRS